MKISIYILLLLISAAVAIGWSWKRLLDFNSYKKPFWEGVALQFFFLLLASIWWLFTADFSKGIMGVFYYLLAFLSIMVIHGYILHFLFSKKKMKEEAE
jgi:CDP-diglyceride synthetase